MCTLGYSACHLITAGCLPPACHLLPDNCLLLTLPPTLPSTASASASLSSCLLHISSQCGRVRHLIVPDQPLSLPMQPCSLIDCCIVVHVPFCHATSASHCPSRLSPQPAVNFLTHCQLAPPPLVPRHRFLSLRTLIVLLPPVRQRINFSSHCCFLFISTSASASASASASHLTLVVLSWLGGGAISNSGR